MRVLTDRCVVPGKNVAHLTPAYLAGEAGRPPAKLCRPFRGLAGTPSALRYRRFLVVFFFGLSGVFGFAAGWGFGRGAAGSTFRGLRTAFQETRRKTT